MRKLAHLAAPAALLAAAAALPAPASAEPQRLDEARLAGVAAGQLGITSLNRTDTITELSSLRSVTNNLGQSLSGASEANNNATAVLGSSGVNAAGNANNSLTAVIASLGGAGGAQ